MPVSRAFPHLLPVKGSIGPTDGKRCCTRAERKQKHEECVACTHLRRALTESI